MKGTLATPFFFFRNQNLQIEYSKMKGRASIENFQKKMKK